MTRARDASAARPALAFRVGVTGTRVLAEPARDAARGEIDAVLRIVAGRLDAAAATPAARGFYRIAPDGRVVPRLRALSPLAAGADQLFAEVALGLGCELDVALPFARDDYAQDFDAAARATFDLLLEGRPFLEMDGGRERELRDDENRSYEAVGRLVARNCDLLVAIWDGRPARGRGGTGDIVGFAAELGPPVWWIDAAGAAPPRLLRSTSDLQRPDDAPRGAAARTLLAQTIDAALSPPAPLDAGRSRVRVLDHAATPDAGGFWRHHARRADAAAIACRDRRRRIDALVAGAAATAVASALASLAFAAPAAPLLELLCLAAATTLAILERRRDRHGEWHAAHRLAELCRAQEALAELGSSLPCADRHETRVAASCPAGSTFDALRRAAPLATGRLSAALPRIRDLVQATLTARRAQPGGEGATFGAGAARRLSGWGALALLAAFALALVQLGLAAFGQAGSPSSWAALDCGAAILSAVAASLFGVRAYAAAAPLRRPSTREEPATAEAAARIAALRLDRPLASQDLAALVFDLSAEMLRDTDA